VAIDGQLSEVLGAAAARHHVPGAAAGLLVDGECHTASYGVTNVDHPLEVDDDTLFQVGSITKTFTSAAIMLLVEEGRVRLDDPVDRWLPELADRRVLRRLDGPVDGTVPAVRPITVRDLLTFTSGYGLVMAEPGSTPIQVAMDELQLAQGMPSPQVAPEPDEWIRRLGTLPLLHQPGEQWA